MGGRDLAIDAVRGICIVSMVAAHLAKGSRFDDAMHPLEWVDGASGFVLLSGLLIGLVQHSTMDRQGERAGYLKLAKRVRLIYLGHLLIAAAALAVGTLDADRTAGMPSVQGEGGWGIAVLRALTLQINPAYASVLSLYVVVMVASVPLLWLLRRRQWALGGGYVLAIYVTSLIWSVWTQLPQRAGEPGGWSYGTWFGLFAVGVGIGWAWRHPTVQRAVSSRAGLALGVAAAAGGTVTAVVLSQHDVGIRVLDKEVLGPGRIALAVAVYYVVWQAVGWVTSHWATVVRPLSLLGTRSLDSYMILSVLVIVVPSVSAHEQASRTGTVVAGSVVLLCLLWAHLRGRRPRGVVADMPGRSARLRSAR